MTEVQVLYRRRFYPVDGAQVTRLADNAWQVHIPVDHPIHAKTRRTPDADGWEGAVLLVDDAETEPVVVSKVAGGRVQLAAWSIG